VLAHRSSCLILCRTDSGFTCALRPVLHLADTRLPSPEPQTAARQKPVKLDRRDAGASPRAQPAHRADSAALLELPLKAPPDSLQIRLRLFQACHKGLCRGWQPCHGGLHSGGARPY